ncbi:MAG: Mini-ribonuclease 3 [Peptococcaceae bacterium]|jgi:ribonuclease-3 family protein|nr:Mini-ribonuclease 3 [Peptococcaceae bacterium]
MKPWQEMNALALAYLGDAVYEFWVRTYLLETGMCRVNELHKTAVKYVCAETQAALLHRLLSSLDEEETEVVLRGRNTKGYHPKHVDVTTYRHATGLEALVGYWQLNERTPRIQWALQQVAELLRS